MSETNEVSRKLDEILSMLSGLVGVRKAFYLTRQVMQELARIERSYPAFGPLTVRNDGLNECLKREHVACIIKDKHFRPPPMPTVVLVDDEGTEIGRELLPGERSPERGSSRTFMLGKDFVVFYEKGKGKGAKFVLPPVPFKEVEQINGVSGVCSSSPSATGDFYIKKCYDLDDDPKLASILIGFNLP